MDFDRTLARAYDGARLSLPEISTLLQPPSGSAQRELFDAAYRLKCEIFGKFVNLRGLIEFSNVCTCDCLYCGIRRSNGKVSRYTMSMEEILRAAGSSGEFGYGSVVLQSGERSDAAFVDFVTEVLERIRRLPFRLGITLSCGEQSMETLLRWREAGAKRYLMRIESSSEAIFRAIHPVETSFARRRDALTRLRRAGYVTGSGVMIGLPGQSVDDLARDIDFFREADLDMIGMGPFIPQEDTPLGQRFPDPPGAADRRLESSLRMIAVTRLVLRDVNIASSTALQAIDPENGRQRGILAGANVLMPNTGDVSRRRDYQLYDGKPSLDENSREIRAGLIASLAAIGESPRFDDPGEPVHFLRRMRDEGL